MTKKELIDEVWNRIDEYGRNDIACAVEIVFDAVKDSLMRGERVELRGFGVFTVKDRQPRRGRNPKTGADVPVPAKRIPFFKVGKDLKAMVDN